MFQEAFEIRNQEISVLIHLDFMIYQSTLGLIIDYTDKIMELVKEWFPNGKFIKVDTHFWMEYTHEKEIMATVLWRGNTLQRAEME